MGVSWGGKGPKTPDLVAAAQEVAFQPPGHVSAPQELQDPLFGDVARPAAVGAGHTELVEVDQFAEAFVLLGRRQAGICSGPPGGQRLGRSARNRRGELLCTLGLTPSGRGWRRRGSAV